MDYRDKILSQDYAEFIYPEFIPGEDAIRRYRAEFFQPISVTDSTLYVPLSEAEKLNFINYDYGFIPKLYGLMDTSALEVSGITRVANQPNLGLRGQGTIIGIVDTGIDYMHPAFMDAYGNTRILRIWDQSDAGGPLPIMRDNPSLVELLNLRLLYGSEYTEDMINLAIQSDNPYEIVPSRDYNGHGTFLAGVAGGSESIVNNFSGAATEAKFIVVKLKEAKDYLREYYFVDSSIPAYQDNDIVAAVNYIRMYSSIYGMPVSLIIGLGSSQGGHDGRNLLARELNNYRNNIGTSVTVAAGNEGNARHHYSGRVTRSDEPNEVEIQVSANMKGFFAEIWVDAPKVLSLGILSPTGQIINSQVTGTGQTQVFNFIFEGTRVIVDYDILEETTGNELIFIRFENPEEGIWTLRLIQSNETVSRFNVWLPITPFIGNNVFFLVPDPDITVTDPGMSEDVITVTAYDNRTGAVYAESGRGFSASGKIVPDICSPGVMLTGPNLRNGYTEMSGTSVAAALTAGACSQILTWGVVQGNKTRLSSKEVKNFLIRGADRESGIVYPDRVLGYGKLDIYNSFEILRRTV